MSPGNHLSRRPVPGPRSLPILLLALLLGVSLAFLTTPTPAQAQKKKKTKSLVGKPVGKVVPGAWHLGEPFEIESLHGTPWVLVLVKVQSPRWPDYQELFDRIHRSQEDGGPVVIACVFDRKSRIEKEMGRWPEQPEFYIVGDRHGKIYGRFGRAVYPQFYCIDEKGIVTWEGTSLDKSFQGVLQKLVAGDIPRLADSVAEKPKKADDGGDDDEEDKGDKNARYKARVAKAMADEDTVECIRLLRLAWKKDRRPQHELVGPLWDHIEKAIAKEVKPAMDLIDAEKYAKAREQIAPLRKRYEKFPADALARAWQRLAKEEGRTWYDFAKTAHEAGDTEALRRHVERLRTTYPDSSWTRKALELLPDTGD